MKSALIAAVVAAVVAAASGTAATVIITSKNIKNGTIQTVDISAKAKRALRGQRSPIDPRVRRDKRGRLGQPAHEGRPVRLDHKGRKAQPGRADGPSLRLRNRNGSASAGRPTGFSAVWRSVRGSGGKWLRYAVPSVIRVTVPLPSIGPVVGRLDTDWALLRGAWQQDRTSDELAFVKARREGAGGRFAPGPYRLGAAVRSRREEARTGWRFLSGSNAKTGHPPTHRR